MSIHDADLGEITRELEAAGTFKAERMSVESLANLTEMISLRLNIKMVPGEMFHYNHDTRTLTYNRQQLLTLPPAAAPGLIYHEVGHARHSQSRYNIKNHCQKVADAGNRKSSTGKAIHPGSVFSIIEAAEDERNEALLREDYAQLGATYLPRVDGGWRKEAWDKEFEQLKNVSPPGSMTAEGKPLYWERVKTAVRGLVSGAITEDDLPKDMPWDELTVDAVKELRHSATVDQLMERFSSLVPQFVRFREEYYDPPKPPPGNNKDTKKTNNPFDAPPQKGDGQGEGGGKGDDKPDDSDKGNQDKDESDKDKDEKNNGGGDGDTDKDDDKDDKDEKDEDDKDDDKGDGKDNKPEPEPEPEHEPNPPDPVKTQLEREYAQGTPDKPDKDFNNGGAGAGFSPPVTSRKPPYKGPAWSVIRMSASNMIGPITKQIRRYLRDNEIADKSSGWKSGRFHARSLIRGEVTNTEKLYSRRDQKGQLSYAVSLLVDCSSSMRGCEKDVRPFPAEFGGLQNRDSSRLRYPVCSCDGYYRADDTGDAPKAHTCLERGQYGAKWTFATRLCVALAECVSKYREVKLGIFRFDNDFTVVKDFKQTLNQEVKQHVMDDITGNVDGGTENAKAFIKIADAMKNLNVDKRLCIVLTDGQFTDYGTENAIKYMKSKGIEMVVLTVGVDADVAQQYVGERFAEKVTDDTVGPVLGHHLKRMVAGK